MQPVMPEVWLVLGMCAVILVPFINRGSHVLPLFTALAGIVLALVATISVIGEPGQSVFHGMLAIDPFSQFFKVLLLLFTLFIVVLWLMTTRDETHVYDVPDYYCLLLGAVFGMALMASANNLLMIFIATEMASLPSFALAGFRKRHQVATEGSLKYVVFGAVSSAIMLYGMSLVYGMTGTLGLSGVAAAASQDFSPLLAIGLLAMFAGIAFKLSAVPLHFWCPDVFQGAPFEVTTFLSVASKGAAVVLLLRILHNFGVQSGEAFVGMAVGVAILGGITATWGNLLAYHQTNIKRLLAYSSIAHAGYMIMAASLMVLVRTDSDPGLAASVAGAILFYLLVYLFMNLGAFTVAAVLARQTGNEDIRHYGGLINRSPMLTVLMSIFLLSLFGMPGLGGFMGKIYLMKAMAEVGGGAGIVLIALLLINTLISLYYYLRPVYFMVMVPDTESRPSVSTPGVGMAILTVCVIGVLWTGVLPGGPSNLSATYSDMTVAVPSTAQQGVSETEVVVPMDAIDARSAQVIGDFP